MTPRYASPYAVQGPTAEAFRRAIASGRSGARQRFARYIAAWAGYFAAPRQPQTCTVSTLCAETIAALTWLSEAPAEKV